MVYLTQVLVYSFNVVRVLCHNLVVRGRSRALLLHLLLLLVHASLRRKHTCHSVSLPCMP
jgi:hypothetical protein